MKCWTTLIILSTIILAKAAAAINEPVASPTAATNMERQLQEYERLLGTDVTGVPTEVPGRPTDGSFSYSYISNKSKGSESITGITSNSSGKSTKSKVGGSYIGYSYRRDESGKGGSSKSGKRRSY